MSLLKVEYNISGKRYDKEDDIYYWGGNKQLTGGEFTEETDFGHKYQTLMSYANFTNETLSNALISFAKQEVDAGLAVNNDFLVGLRVSDVNTKHMHLDIHLDMNYKDGALLPKILWGTKYGYIIWKI